nr:immunoglobulin light chain junction region [Macaca mulatta]
DYYCYSPDNSGNRAF